MSHTYFENLTEAVPEIPPDSIVSRTIHDGDDSKAILFGFAPGQSLSEHTASRPATLQFLSGEAELALGDEVVDAHAGTWVHMPARLEHSVRARTQVVMLLVLLGGG